MNGIFYVQYEKDIREFGGIWWPGDIEGNKSIFCMRIASSVVHNSLLDSG